MVAKSSVSTVANLDNLPDDGNRYELVNGEIIVAAAPTWQHQQIVGYLYRRIADWVESHDLGQVSVAPVDVVLDQLNVVQPDVVVVSRNALPQLRDGKVHGAPLLVVEVMSPTSRGCDAVSKLFLYAEAGIAEYWLADPQTRTLQVLQLRAARYEPVEPAADGSIASAVLQGLVIASDAIWSHPSSQES